MLPQDPFILLSYINTRLRDGDYDLNELCEDLGFDREDLELRLSEIGYRYDAEKNSFK